jgi:hypothetical protein
MSVNRTIELTVSVVCSLLYSFRLHETKDWMAGGNLI